MDKRITEQPSHYDHLELMSVEQITANINRENMSVSWLWTRRCLPSTG